MAIIIKNVNPSRALCGEHEYEVRINTVVKARFWHKREEGLTVCLRKAMEAVERTEREAAIAAQGWPRCDGGG